MIQDLRNEYQWVIKYQTRPWAVRRRGGFESQSKERIRPASPFINLSEYSCLSSPFALWGPFLPSSSEADFWSKGFILFVLYNPFTVDIPRRFSWPKKVTVGPWQLSVQQTVLYVAGGERATRADIDNDENDRAQSMVVDGLCYLEQGSS